MCRNHLSCLSLSHSGSTNNLIAIDNKIEQAMVSWDVWIFILDVKRINFCC